MTDETLAALAVATQYFLATFALYFMFEIFALMWRMFMKPQQYD